MTDCTDLAPHLTVEQAVTAYERADRAIRAGFALIAEAEKLLTDTFEGSQYGSIHLRGRWDRCPDFTDAPASLIEVRRQVWQALIARLELRRFMSITAWEQLQKDLERGEIPEITQATVLQMAEQFRSRMPQMLEQAVAEVFNWLRPRGGTRLAQYKTNDVVEVGRKVIIGWGVEQWACSWNVCSHADQKLSALENVFTALDGKGSVTRSHYSGIATTIRQIKVGQPCEGETEYFRFRGFKNRNLHIEFMRLDLLQKFNAIAGGANLRPAKEGTDAA